MPVAATGGFLGFLEAGQNLFAISFLPPSIVLRVISGDNSSTSYTTVVRTVWDIHRGREVIRALGLRPRALITSCTR